MDKIRTTAWSLPSEPAESNPSAWRPRAWIPWAVLGLWTVLLMLALPFASKLHGATTDRQVDYLPASAQSTQVARLLDAMPGGGTTDLVLVYQRPSGLTAADWHVVRNRAAALSQKFQLVGGPPRAIPAGDGQTMMIPLAVAQRDGDAKTVVPEVRAQATEDRHGGLSVRLGGQGALAADMDRTYGSINGLLLVVTVSVVAVLLIVTYRSPLLWLVPLVCTGVAAVAGMAVADLLVRASGLTVNAMSSGVMTVLIFGAGTDYALLLIARYRDELRTARSTGDAMVRALRRAGPAVVTSAGTVVAGLTVLLLADMNSSRAIGPIGAVGVICALAAMMTLLPAVLVLLGRRMFWPLVPVYGSEPSARHGMYHRVGALVTRRRMVTLVSGMAALGALTLGTLNLSGHLRQEDAFTRRPESVIAMREVAAAFPGRSSQPVTVLAHTPDVDSVAATARGIPGVAAVSRGRTANGWTELNVTTMGQPESRAETASIKRLRAALGDQALVGGRSAQRMDTEHTTARDRVVVIPLVLAAVLLLLAALLRSLVAAALLLAAVAVVWAAALGLGGLVFGPLLDFEGNDPTLPLLAFVFLVALGVDYGIFLLHRMREERAVVPALTATGGVIASAGVVLAATFAVLTVLPLVSMVELGFVIGVGVLLDTFLVRTFLVPACALLLGRHLWWPGAPATTGAAGGSANMPGTGT
ncbi:MMPL family transporter [Actinomadura oligospora]|uniref:MMPL family transporter n=1 Tax=Actinomadura oligospora TaxID=111804 RepID=UPI000A007F04|nr:MMPL family transporter [Actinomadura oligospora]